MFHHALMPRAGIDASLYKLQKHYNRIRLQQQKQIDLQMERVNALEQRLSPTPFQLCEIIDIISAKHLRIIIIIGNITLDCRNGKPDPMNEAFLQIAGVFSQLELAMIRARVRSGMENTRAKGKPIGRPTVYKYLKVMS